MFFSGFRNNHDMKGSRWIPYTIATCSAVALYTVLNNLPRITGAVSTFFSLISPVLIGIAIAYLLTPVVKFFDRLLSGAVKREFLRNGIAVAISAVGILVLITILMSFLVPQLIDSIVQFINNINVYSRAASEVIDSLNKTAEAHNLDTESVRRVVNELIDNAVRFISNNAQKMLKGSVSYGGSALNILIGAIVGLYFLVSKKSILNGLDRLGRLTIKKEEYESLKVFLHKCNNIFSSFIAQDLLDAIIVGVINFIFMSIMNIPYAVLISVVVGVTNLAPTFGPFVGAFIGAFILFFADAGNTIIFLIFTLILQLVDGYVIKPRLFGNTLGVPGVWITVGIILGGKFFGVLGILLAVPLVGIITFLYREYIDRKEQEVNQNPSGPSAGSV